jgi:adenylate cyclase
MPILRITDAEGSRMHGLEGEVTTIGRGPGNSIILKDLASSSKHAQILKDAAGWLLEDRGSLNGTFVNDVQAEKGVKIRLKQGDRVLIGSTEIAFDEPPPTEATVPMMAQQPPSTPGYANSFLQSIIADDEEHAQASGAAHHMLHSVVIDDRNEVSEAGSQFAFLKVDGGSIEEDVRTMLFATQVQPPQGSGSAFLPRKPGETLAEIKLRLIQRVGEKLVRIFEPKQLMEEIMSMVIEQTGADRGVLCLLDDKNLPVPIAQHGMEDEETVRISRTVLRRVLDERSGVLINESGAGAANIYRSLAEMRVHSTLCVPLWTGDRIIGLLSLDSTRQDRTFTQQDLEVLLAIAHQAAMGIERGRLSQLVESERQMRSYLSKYLDNRIVETITHRTDGADPLAPAMRVVTVLFSDIVSFTKMSEGLDPAEVGTFIRDYLTAMTEIIFAHGGTIDKYIGDAVMALFGAPVPSDDSASSAIRAALEMRDRVREMKTPGKMSGMLRVRFGINTGLVVVGNFGSARRTEYTAIGDAVNVASRLQTFARPNEICIDEDTNAKTSGAFQVEEIGTVDVKNRAQPIAVFKVLRAK